MNKLIDREQVIHDVENLAYIVADVREGQYPAHSLHQLFDVRAPGNIDRINRLLDVAIAELHTLLPNPLRDAFSRSLNGSSSSNYTSLDFSNNYTSLDFSNIVAAAHEYLVTRVFTDWLELTLPPSAAISVATGRTSVSATTYTSASTSRSGADEAIRIWREKCESAKSTLLATAASQSSLLTPTAFTRRLPPL